MTQDHILKEIQRTALNGVTPCRRQVFSEPIPGAI